MKILHISRTDLVGGRFTGYYMHQGINSSASSAKMTVWQKESNSSWVYSSFPAKPSLPWIINGVAWRLDKLLALEGLTGMGGWRVIQQPEFQEADIIHLHLIHDSPWFSPLALPFLSMNKPMAWTIHDCWPMTGACTYHLECDKWTSGCQGKCPHPRSRSVLAEWTPTLHWQVKRQIYRNLDVTLITASNWVQQRVKKSPLLNYHDCHLIPFGIDLKKFYPRNKLESKKKLGLDPNQKVIVFRSMKQSEDKFKGIYWIHQALELYQPQQPTCLLTLQDGQEFMKFYPKYRVLDLGWADGEQLIDALCAADVFLMPSIAESFGLMAIEAMACGTPVIVFDGTSLPEIIHSPDGGGIVVPLKNSIEFANAIKLILEDDNLRLKLGNQARLIAEKNYSFDLYLSRHLNLYEKIIENRNSISSKIK